MKTIIITLVALILFLQYELWIAKDGFRAALNLKESIVKQKISNKKVADRNKALTSDIKSLKNGNQSIEAHARNDLGMVKKGEVFYQVVKANSGRQ